MYIKPIWNFPRRRRGYMLIDPVEGEFFTTDHVGGLDQALVRESTQNALDAKDDECADPVLVRYAFGRGKKSLAPKKYKKLTENLPDHLNSSNNGLFDPPIMGAENLSFLVVEDFGTTGLEGDPNADFIGDNGEENFYYFWRNVGRSGKSEGDRGRWGLGKTVFPALSKINTFFGLTNRKSDTMSLLMGQSVLKIHTLGDDNSIQYTPYGHFGEFDTGEESNFGKPITNEEFIDNFKNSFELKRKNDSGLSVVILFPDEEINIDSIINSAVEQYFYPILTGDLIIEVSDLENKQEVVINQSTIERVVKESELNDTKKEKILKIIEFAQWAITQPNIEYYELNEPDASRAPTWRINELFDGIDLFEIRELFNDGERIAFRIPVKVQKTGEDPEISWFKAYIERDFKSTETENYFIREGITILGISSRRQRGIRGLVVIDETPLTELLGDSENPGHTEWQYNALNFKEKYKHGRNCISFVKNSLDRIIRAILSTSIETDEELLKDIFFIEELTAEGDKNQGEKTSAERGKKPHQPIVDPPPRKKPFIEVTKITGGFQIKHSPRADTVEASVSVTIAYDVRRGNAFNRYLPLDFDLGDDSINITTEGTKISTKDKNKLEFETEKKDFWVKVTGFDLQRDLRIKTHWEKKE